ncbi:OLC1v1023833C1 [Oldenlandia corymbosa var. corymbosa]|uniref:RING-type E3 ubiquitin transferase n=1 Tax=Oldenlandia corymbosa var. corymbosa TaxID=529605 RepID=A0AAV1C4F3_OLDCO|nr:OLC1v1023833C1 [Oldenlandia corymbosa var. corymbosa]
MMTLPLGYRAYISRSLQSRFPNATDERLEILVQSILSEIAACREGSDDWDESIEELIEVLIHNREIESSELTEEIILQNLKLRRSQAEDLKVMCVICQCEYQRKEFVGKLGCGHEYHADCIKRWLFENNSCPVCKCKAIDLI